MYCEILITAPKRIVSLIPSATELLFALGAGDRIVGRSHECDFPPSVAELPICTESSIDPKKPGDQIDRDIRELLKLSLSIYRVHPNLLSQLKPDLIVTQDQCEVCAASLKDVQLAVCQLSENPVEIVSLKPHCLADVLEDFKRVGKATGTEEQAALLSYDFQSRLENIRKKTAGLKSKRVACIEWMDPPMIGGGWIPEIAKIAGGEPILVNQPERFKQVDWEQIRASEPEIVVVFPCGFTLEKTVSDLMNSQSASNGLKALRAVKDGKCFLVDGNAYFNRPGPRLADSCEILACLFHSEAFNDLLPKYRNVFLPWNSPF
jgi:iron complex transport system substrate-binding protein